MPTLTLTYLPTGERFEVEAAHHDTAVKREARRALASDGWNACGHTASVRVKGRDSVPDYSHETSQLDRHYRDGFNWQVDGECCDRDYALDACLAVCSKCNGHGKRDRHLHERLDRALLARLDGNAATDSITDSDFLAHVQTFA